MEQQEDSIDRLPAVYPPKFQIAEAPVNNAVYKSLLSLIFYLGLGYMFFRRLDLLLVITAIIVLHEAGHFIAMRIYNYNDVGVFFIPLLGAFVKGSKREISQKQNAVILLAGPLPGILAGIVLYYVNKSYGQIWLGNISLHQVALLMIWVNLINLLPVFPLDGGQLLNRVFLDEESFISNLFIIISGVLLAWIAIHYKIYFLLIFPLLLIFRLAGTQKHIDLEKKITEQGIDLDTSYDALSDESYWKIRSTIIQHDPAYLKFEPGPPFVYDTREEKIATAVEDVLQRNLLQDASVTYKIITALVWIAALTSPWIFNIEFLFSKYFLR